MTYNFEKLSFTEKVILGKKDGFFIYDFTAVNAEGVQMWYLFAVSKEYSDKFLNAIDQGDNELELEDYGSILAFGEGNKAPENIKKEITDKYQLPS